MKRARRRTLPGLLVLAWLLGPSVSQGSVLVVDDDGLECFGAQYATIAGAVAAAQPGDQIVVCPGTYDEQVIITKALKISGRDVNGRGPVLRPTLLPQARPSLFGGNPVTAALIVDGSFVAIQGLRIDLRANRLDACTPALAGVYMRNAGGRLLDLVISNAAVLSHPTCATGVALFAEANQPGLPPVIVTNGTFAGFQKGGIAANGSGVDLRVFGGTVTGTGAAAGVAQNGVQIAFGARGRVDSTIVSATQYSGSDSRAAGLLFYQTSHALSSRSSVTDAQTAVFVVGQRNTVKRGTFSLIADEAVVLFGDRNRVRATTIDTAGVSGIFMDGSSNAVRGAISNTPIGVWNAGGSNNIIRERMIDFTNVATPIETGGTFTLTATAAAPFSTACATPTDCDDGNLCTLDGCDVTTGLCRHTPVADGTPCDDGNACTMSDACTAGVCQGTPVPDGMACATGNLCMTLGTCLFGNCEPGLPIVCDDSNPCTADACSAAVGCEFVPLPDGTSCGPGLTCSGGSCPTTTTTSPPISSSTTTTTTTTSSTTTT